MPKYAKNTEVSSDRSRQEIERTLQRYGATKFMYGWQENRAIIAFEMKDRRVRFDLPMPDANSRDFTDTPTGLARAPDVRKEAFEQAVRQRWRALALVVKAKLEAVDAGITSFELEFLGHIVKPDGQTIGDYLLPQLPAMYQSGALPALLPGN